VLRELFQTVHLKTGSQHQVDRLESLDTRHIAPYIGKVSLECPFYREDLTFYDFYYQFGCDRNCELPDPLLGKDRRTINVALEDELEYLYKKEQRYLKSGKCWPPASCSSEKRSKIELVRFWCAWKKCLHEAAKGRILLASGRLQAVWCKVLKGIRHAVSVEFGYIGTLDIINLEYSFPEEDEDEDFIDAYPTEDVTADSDYFLAELDVLARAHTRIAHIIIPRSFAIGSHLPETLSSRWKRLDLSHLKSFDFNPGLLLPAPEDNRFDCHDEEISFTHAALDALLDASGSTLSSFRYAPTVEHWPSFSRLGLNVYEAMAPWTTGPKPVLPTLETLQVENVAISLTNLASWISHMPRLKRLSLLSVSGDSYDHLEWKRVWDAIRKHPRPIDVELGCHSFPYRASSLRLDHDASKPGAIVDEMQELPVQQIQRHLSQYFASAIGWTEELQRFHKAEFKV
jgi:hypothetical protein